ncbi:MAG TPA: DUF3466 family protein [Chthoniobacteraceae bacterium]|jgi:probable HAF family extracellular repeat protein|nr:DUF3466 family protein [Chthoniobacteraceae bacterium]
MKTHLLQAVAGALFLSSAALYADPPPPPSYQIIDLGAAPGGSSSLATAINASGDIAGQVDFAADNRTYSYLWKFSTRKMTALYTNPAHGSNQAYGINVNADVVGYFPTLAQSNPDIYRSRAFLYKNASGTLAQMDPAEPALEDSYATAINDAGKIVGYYFLNQTSERAFLFDHAQIEIGTLPSGGISLATAINNSDHVVGNATVNSATRAFYWTRAGGITELTAPANYQTYARGINSTDHIAGIARISAVNHAMLYVGGTITDLGNNGGQSSEARGLNDSDQIVGEYKDTGGTTHAFLYTDGVFHDLNDLIAPGQAGGFTNLKSAAAINASGWIAGYGDTAANGGRSFIAIPAGAVTQGPPVSATGSADAVSATGATLHGSVNPDGYASTAWFEYGLTTHYGSRTGVQAVPIGTDAVSLSATLKLLRPHTLYHFRMTGKNAKGQVSGDDGTFTTLDTAPLAKADLVLSTSARPLTIAVLLNDKDPDHDKLAGGTLTNGAHGTTVFQSGKVIYTPGVDFTGADTFTYDVGDGFGQTVTGAVYIVNAKFDGLVRAADNSVAGVAKSSLTAARGFSLAVNLGGHAYSTAGSFAASDDFHKVLAPRGLPALTVDAHLDLAHAQLSCVLNDGTNGFTAVLSNAVAIWAGGAHKYTATLAPGDPALPRGTGYGIMSVTAAGAVTIAGKLGDGAPWSASASLHADGTWNCYAPITVALKPAGYLGGAVTFAPVADSDCAGTLHWVRTAGASGDVTFKAAQYTGLATQQVLTFTNTVSGAATFTLADGNLDAPIPHNLTVSARNVVAVTDPVADKLAVRITATTGLLSGTFHHPKHPLPATPFSGVIYQKGNLGGLGEFVGIDTSGTITLVPQ